MKFANIKLGVDVDIDPSSSINNVIIGDCVRIAKRCSLFGGSDNLLTRCKFICRYEQHNQWICCKDNNR